MEIVNGYCPASYPDISQLLQIIGYGNILSATSAVVHLTYVQNIGNSVRQRQVEEHEGSTFPVVIDKSNCYHAYNRCS